MKKKRARILSLLLTLAMVTSLLPGTALAAEPSAEQPAADSGETKTAEPYISIEGGKLLHGTIYDNSYDYYIRGSVPGDKLKFVLNDKDGKPVSGKVTWESLETYQNTVPDENDTIDFSTWTSYAYFRGTCGDVTATIRPYRLEPLAWSSGQGFVKGEDGVWTLTLPEDGSELEQEPYIAINLDTYIQSGIVSYSFDNKDVAVAEKSGGSAIYLRQYHPGKGKLTVRVNDLPEYEITADVVIKGIEVRDEKKVSGLTELYAGKTLQLSAFDGTDNNKFTWYSEDETVATVDENGLVSGLAEGSTYIHAKVGEGDDAVIGGIHVYVYGSETKPYITNLEMGDGSRDLYFRAKDENGNWLNQAEGDKTFGYTGYGFARTKYEYGAYSENKSVNGGLNITLTPTYSENKYKLTYLLDGEALTDLDTGSGKGAKISLPTGESTLVVRLTDAKDAENFTDYTFHIWQEYSNDGRLNNVKVVPYGRTTAGIKFNLPDAYDTTKVNFVEGTGYLCYKADHATYPNKVSVTIPGYSNLYSTTSYFDTSYANTYLFQGTEQLTLNAAAYSSTGKFFYRVGSAEWNATDKDTLPEGWAAYDASNPQPITWKADEGKDYMTIGLHIISEKDFLNDGYLAQLGETTSSWNKASNLTQFELHVYQLPITLEDAQDMTQIKDLKLSEGSFMTPAYTKGNSSASAVIPSSCQSVDITLYVPDDMAISVPGATPWARPTVLTVKDGVCEDKGIATTKDKTSRSYSLTATKTVGEGDSAFAWQLVNTFSVSLNKSGNSVVGLPDEVIDFIAPGSQYTNGRQTQFTSGRQYAIYPERTLLGSSEWTDVTSLGNFGGNIVWYYKDAIKDDPNNKYGVDFCIYGNSYGYGQFGAGESGQVWVSEDGETWYALAGSDHYEDSTIWDYTFTYKNNNSSDGFDWSDNKGNGGTWTNKALGLEYPKTAMYPLHAAKDSSYTDDSLTLSGVLLRKTTGNTIDVYHGQAYAHPNMFGYVDALASSKAYSSGGDGTGDALTRADGENPYARTGMGSSFDLAWAVDANGDPVSFPNGIHYIKVQTAVMGDGGIMGELSTEVSTCLRTVNDEDAKPVGRTEGLKSITLSQENSDETVTIQADDFTKLSDAAYTADVSAGYLRNLLFTVNAADGDNIYVNNQPIENGQTTTTTYAVDKTTSRTVRVIVQSGEKEPVSYFLHITGEAVVSEAVLNVEKLIGEIGTVTKDSGDKIKAARSAYDALSEADKKTVSNYNVLTEAEKTYNAMTGGGVGKSDKTITVTLSIEKFVLGQGYIQEPVLVSVPEDTNIAQILVALQGLDNVNFKGSTGSSGFYLAYVADKEEIPNIPAEILNKLGSKYNGMRESADWLGEMDYTSDSGWMYSVNDSFPNVMSSAYELKDGDTIRWQFTLYGYGADLGADNSEWGGESMDVAKKAALTRTMARANALTNASALQSQSVYQDAKNVLETWNSTQEEVDAACKALEEAIASGDYGRVQAKDLKPKQNQSNTSSTGTVNADDQKAANTVIDQIKAIGDVTKDSGDKIKAARDAYDKLTEAQKKLVTNYGTLTDAERAYAGLTGKLPFTDVNGHWAYDAIKYAYENSLFAGTSATTFGPNVSMNRAMLVTVLYRLDKEPSAETTSSFKDVPAGQWYTKAVAWASANKIVSGYSADTFGPTDTITREQMASILYRYAQYKGYDVSKTTDLVAFTDKASVSDWALTSMQWANAEKLINGRTATTLVPQGNATRAEVAQILMTFAENVAK